MTHKRRTQHRPAPAARPEHDADHAPAPIDLACESVAGEEDPGASIEEGIALPPPRCEKDDPAPR